MMELFWRVFKISSVLCLILVLLSGSVIRLQSPSARASVYTNHIAFNFVNWTVNALWEKLAIASTGINRYLTHDQRRAILSDYIDLIEEEENLQSEIDTIYSDPYISRPQKESLDLRIKLTDLENQEDILSILAETVIQVQVTEVIETTGLALLNQPIPPVLFRVSDLPKNLILSPRAEIRQEASISLQPDLTNEQINLLEERVQEELGFSALVVPVGGIGSYPTMVIRTKRLANLFETVAHEWIHNYLTWHPLGVRYNTSPTLRTMNETTASIAGDEMSIIILNSLFSRPSRQERIDQRPRLISFNSISVSHNQNNHEFDFQQEMYETRLRAEELLVEGKISEAEKFMESRRQIFWENGYQIRRLNQAYFAFYGAYADKPISAAGEDPVGRGVRILRKRSQDLESFAKTMAGIKNYQELRILVESF